MKFERIAVRDMRDGHWRYGVGVRVDLSELTKEIQADGFPFNLERATTTAWAHGLGCSLLVAAFLATVAASWANRGVIKVPVRMDIAEDDSEDTDDE